MKGRIYESYLNNRQALEILDKMINRTSYMLRNDFFDALMIARGALAKAVSSKEEEV